jgi:hypothetical protein
MSEAKMVYVVAGNTGEYSDSRTWHVRAFTDKAQAEALCKRLNDWCKEKGVNGREYDGGTINYYEFKEKPIEDSGFDLDYTGTDYGVLEIPLEA